MTPEHEKKLRDDYPEILGDVSIDVGDGWYTLLDVLCSALYWRYAEAVARDHHYKGLPANKASKYPPETLREYLIQAAHDVVTQRAALPRAVQIKEKFGGLRFYVDGGSEKAGNYISFAEQMSMRMCETCGAPGKRQGKGWIRTLCDVHAGERT